jgi:hypothetical protein
MSADTMRDKTYLLDLMLARHQPDPAREWHETTFNVKFCEKCCDTTSLEDSSGRISNMVARLFPIWAQQHSFLLGSFATIRGELFSSLGLTSSRLYGAALII